MAQVRFALALCLLLVHGVTWEAQAASYNVGNSAGWDLSADFPSWVDGKTFNVGDVLGMNHGNILCLVEAGNNVFGYSKYHNLDEVDEAGFKNCSAANALLSWSDGNTTVPLTAPGHRYFICSNQMHCLGGMKLQVLVGSPRGAAAAGAPAGAPEANPGAALGPGTDDAGIPTLVLGGSSRMGVGPLLVTLICIAAALFV